MVAEQEVTGLRGIGVGDGSLEPLVGVAAVVGGQVTHHPHALRVSSGGQSGQCFVAA